MGSGVLRRPQGEIEFRRTFQMCGEAIVQRSSCAAEQEVSNRWHRHSVCAGVDTMGEPQLRIRRRNLPHWTLEGSTYFVTFRIADGALSEAERHIVLDHIISGEGRFYILGAAVIMP